VSRVKRCITEGMPLHHNGKNSFKISDPHQNLMVISLSKPPIGSFRQVLTDSKTDIYRLKDTLLAGGIITVQHGAVYIITHMHHPTTHTLAVVQRSSL